MDNYRSIVIEGGDQVGKADASKNIINILKKKMPLTMLSFPTYSMPLGAAIRYMLKDGLVDIVEERNISKEEEFQSRMAMYALNRLEVINSLLIDRYKDRLLIFDRSPYSNALTIAYGIGCRNAISREQISYYAKLGLETESFMLEGLNLKNCIIELFDDSEKWLGSRSEGDDEYENSSVQSVCGDVYSEYAKRVGKGWCKIATKRSNSWRERDDILNDCLKFIYSRYPEIQSMECEEPDVEILELTEPLRALYLDSSVSKEHMDSLRESLEKNDKKTLYENSLSVAGDTVDSMSAVVWSSEEIKNAFKEVLEKNMFCLDIIEKFLGSKYVKLLKKSLE